jgi:hypothetical protein
VRASPPVVRRQIIVIAKFITHLHRADAARVPKWRQVVIAIL